MIEAPPQSPRGAARARPAVDWASLAVFAVGLLLMGLLQAHFRPLAEQGTYFQEHSSEDMMQTAPLVDLREHPLETLLVLHIQPPLLDALRASLARLWPDAGRRALALRVDHGLYLVWMVVYAAMGVLVFRWLRAILSRTGIALVAALVFFFHPAAIYYATFLEGTLLTCFGILWLSYALWRVPAAGATPSLVGAYLLLFLVRSIFQWPALVVLVAALLLRRAPRRSVLIVFLSCGAVIGAFMLKQYLLLGTTSTSSFAGMSCLQALGEEPEIGFTSPTDPPLGPLFSRLFPAGAPAALTRETKIGGAHNFNHLADLRNGRALARRCRERLTSDPPSQTLAAWAENLSIYFQPSSRYLTAHVIVDRLPWRRPYDWVFSGFRLALLLAAAAVVWLRGRTASEVRRGLGLALPVLFVAFVSVAFDRSENMRFKFFVEPVLYVFLVAQAAALVRARRVAPLDASAAEAPR